MFTEKLLNLVLASILVCYEKNMYTHLSQSAVIHRGFYIANIERLH